MRRLRGIMQIRPQLSRYLWTQTPGGILMRGAAHNNTAIIQYKLQHRQQQAALTNTGAKHTRV